MSRPQMMRPSTTDDLSDRVRAMNFSRPITSRTQSHNDDLLRAPDFDLTSEGDNLKPSKPQLETSKYRYVPHIRITDDEEDNSYHKSHLRLVDDEDEDEDEDEASLDESIGTATTTEDESYETDPPSLSTGQSTSSGSSSESSSKPLSPTSPPANLDVSTIRPSLLQLSSFNSTSSAAPKPLKVRPPKSRFARAPEPELETIPSNSPPENRSPFLPPPLPEQQNHEPEPASNVDLEEDFPPDIPSRAPRIVKRVSLDQHSEYLPQSSASNSTQYQLQNSHRPSHTRNSFSFDSTISHATDNNIEHEDDLLFAPGAFPDPLARPESSMTISTEFQEPWDAPDLPTLTTYASGPVSNPPRSSHSRHTIHDNNNQSAYPGYPYNNSQPSSSSRPSHALNRQNLQNLPHRESNSSSRLSYSNSNSHSLGRSNSEASYGSGSSGGGARHPVEGLTEKEIKKLRKKGINPELFAEMREARRQAHGKRARLVGSLVGSTFVN
ncbi:MAG: hypothetical protein M1820_004895 [Bogoriella megaspora]|nr:MAG: hypothetical protein M1820_004895 [Bogoriella megaspora]